MSSKEKKLQVKFLYEMKIENEIIWGNYAMLTWGNDMSDIEEPMKQEKWSVLGVNLFGLLLAQDCQHDLIWGRTEI